MTTVALFCKRVHARTHNHRQSIAGVAQIDHVIAQSQLRAGAARLDHVITKINRLLPGSAVQCSMSLFKTREWWTATSDDQELHTAGCLLVAALEDNRYGKCIMKITILNTIIRCMIWPCILSSLFPCRQDCGGQFEWVGSCIHT